MSIPPNEPSNPPASQSAATPFKMDDLLAQEMEQAFPEVVFENTNGTKGVAYGNIVSVLIEAIKEQQKQIDDLRNQLNNK